MWILRTIAKITLLVIFCLWLTACGGGSSGDEPTVYNVGDLGPAGGIVFHIADGGLHGLEASLEDQAIPFDPGAEWGCAGTEIAGADGTEIGTGAQNTADILAGCATAGIAARLADDYTVNGFDDWFLPSEDEMAALYLHQYLVGGFAPFHYWGSTEISAIFADTWRFSAVGQCGDCIKGSFAGVRAVRAF
jgi:hypothetical protein